MRASLASGTSGRTPITRHPVVGASTRACCTLREARITGRSDPATLPSVSFQSLQRHLSICGRTTVRQWGCKAQDTMTFCSTTQQSPLCVITIRLFPCCCMLQRRARTLHCRHQQCLWHDTPRTGIWTGCSTQDCARCGILCSETSPPQSKPRACGTTRFWCFRVIMVVQHVRTPHGFVL